MKKILLGVLLALSIPFSASAGVQEDVNLINSDFDKNAFYTDFAEVFTAQFDDSIEDLDEAINKSTIKQEKNIYIGVNRNNLIISTDNNTAAFYSYDKIGNNIGYSMAISSNFPVSSISSADRTVYRVESYNGIPINRQAFEPTKGDVMNLHYEIESILGMELSEKENSFTENTFSIKPLITANIPYDITLTHDGKVKDKDNAVVASDVTYSYADANATSITGNVLSYPMSVLDTTIVATPNSSVHTKAGEYTDEINVVVSPQQGVN